MCGRRKHQQAGHTTSDATQQYVSAGELQAQFPSLIQGLHTSLAMAVAENRGQGGRYMTPPTFQDGDDPELFLRKFENCAEANGWSYKGSALVNRVLNSMKKPADGWYQREILPQASLLTWIEFKALFIAEYTQPLHVIQNQLKARKQEPTEGVKAFAHDVRWLFAQAHIPPHLQVGTFVEKCRPTLSELLTFRQPRDLDEAITMATAYEAETLLQSLASGRLATPGGRGEAGAGTGRVGPEGQGRYVPPQQRSQQVTIGYVSGDTRNQLRFLGTNNLTCYSSGNPNHFIKDCPERQVKRPLANMHMVLSANHGMDWGVREVQSHTQPNHRMYVTGRETEEGCPEIFMTNLP